MRDFSSLTRDWTEYYLALKEMSYQAIDMEEPYMHIRKWKKSVWKGFILHDSNYMTQKRKTMEAVEDQQLLGVRREG